MKKTAMIVIAVMALAHVAAAGQLLSYIAMPIGAGYATDAKGGRYPNAICMKDVLSDVLPLYPYYANVGCQARDLQGSGMFRLNIDVSTGRVSEVTTIKSMGDRGLDDASINAFKRWVFTPDKWREVIIPTTVRKKWVAIVH